ncbi:MAG: amino acid racemase [Sphingorhabdus sp.]
MRKIGLIGGMSWHSTATYYNRINEQVQRRNGGMSSAPMVIENLDFADVRRCESEEDWKRAFKILQRSAKRLERTGATAIFIAANSMHRVYDGLAEAVGVPVLHIADCVGERMKADGITKASIIGTRQVMTESFYRQRLVAHGVSLTPPDQTQVSGINRIIYEELMLGKATRDSERLLKTIITNIAKDEVQAIVLGCTELEMIVTEANILPIYNGAHIHADAAVEWIFGEKE